MWILLVLPEYLSAKDCVRHCCTHVHVCAIYCMHVTTKAGSGYSYPFQIHGFLARLRSGLVQDLDLGG